MVRDRNVYRCQQCGFASPKPGTCPDCKRMTGELMALVEERAAPEPGGRRIGLSSSRPRALSDITMEHTDRLRTGIGELDRVLGGGVVPGSLVLIGGDPGIGKSTLLIQAARALATAAPPVLYVSAEESAAQVKLRADRLGIAGDGLLLWTETDLTAVEAELDTVKPQILVIDSIQTVFLPPPESPPGGGAQVREAGGRALAAARAAGAGRARVVRRAAPYRARRRLQPGLPASRRPREARGRAAGQPGRLRQRRRRRPRRGAGGRPRCPGCGGVELHG